MVENSKPTDFERDKWVDEVRFKERELVIKERELQHKINNSRAGQLSSTTVVALVLAVIAIIGNALVVYQEGRDARQLESQKAEDTRILEMIKTGDPDTAAVNLKFLLDTKLIREPETIESLGKFLEKRPPGTGPVLAAQVKIKTQNSKETSELIDFLAEKHPAKNIALSVGHLIVFNELDGPNEYESCSVLLVAMNKVLVPDLCLQDYRSQPYPSREYGDQYELRLAFHLPNKTPYGQTVKVDITLPIPTSTGSGYSISRSI